LDASVVVCIATGETSDELQELAALWATIGERFIAPNFLGHEFTNALYKAIKKGAELSAAMLASDTFRQMNIELLDCSDIHEEALALSAKYGMRASYDSHNLLLAAKQAVDLYTCDRTFGQSLRSDWPRVHWVPQRSAGQQHES
jgi:predicted nucleic acid-binding protein